MTEFHVSQWVIDSSFLVLFYAITVPLIIGLILILIFLCIGEVKQNNLKKDYLRSLSDNDKKVIDDYLENTTIGRVQHNKRKNEQKERSE